MSANSVIIAATSSLDGDYIGNSSLKLERFYSFSDLRQHIKNEVEYFLERPGYSDAMEDFSHLVIKSLANNKRKDIKEKDTLLLEVKKDEALTKTELKTHIDTIIDFMEEFYNQFQLDSKAAVSPELTKRILILSPEDQPDSDNITVIATNLKFHMFFSQAPNRNAWSQLDICITY